MLERNFENQKNIMEFLRDFEHEMNHYSIIGKQTIELKVKIHKAEKRSFITQTEKPEILDYQKEIFSIYR